MVPPLTAFTKLNPLPAVEGPHPQVDLAELAAAAGLLLVAVVGLGIGRDRLEVGHVRNVRVHLELVPVLEPLLDDVEMQIAHSRDHQLMGLDIAADRECRVLIGDLGKPGRDLRLVFARLGLDSPGNHRGRELDRPDLELGDRRIAADVAQGVGNMKVLELGDRHDIAGDRLGHLFLLLALKHVDVARPWPVLPLRRLTSVVSGVIRPLRIRR